MGQQILTEELGASIDDLGGLSVKEFCSRYRISRPTSYKEIANKRLRAVKVGAKTIVLRSDAKAWEQALPGCGS